MSSRFYQAPGLDIERIGRELTQALQAQGYQVQQLGNRDQVAVQMRKGGDLEALVGLQAAVTVTLQKTPEGVIAQAGQQKWLDKAAVGAIGFFFPPLWPLALTASFGVFRQVGIENDLFNMLDTIVLRQKAGVRIGDVPPHMQPNWAPPQGFPTFTPPWQQRHSAPHAQQAKRCPNCQAVNEPEDRFCSHCGSSLQEQQVQHCPRCQAPVRPNTTFCTHCGTQIKGEPQNAKEPAAPSEHYNEPEGEPVSVPSEQYSNSEKSAEQTEKRGENAPQE